jgi:hypothetical protein
MRRAWVGLLLIAVWSPVLAEEGKEAKEGKLQVDVQFARELAERKPVEPGQDFAPGKLYCWNEIKGGEGEFVVTHVWFRDGKQVRKQPVRAKGKKWVTWSFHKVTPGAWRVEVQDSSGVVLQSGEFTVK